MVSQSRGPSRHRYQVAIRQGGIRKRWEFASAEDAEQARGQLRKLRDAGVELRATSVDQRKERPDPNLWFDPTRRWTPSERLYLELIADAKEALSSRRAKIRREAWDWIMSDERTDPCSFAVCCDVIEREVAETRERLLGGEKGWQREPTRPLALVRKGSVEN